VYGHSTNRCVRSANELLGHLELRSDGYNIDRRGGDHPNQVERLVVGQFGGEPVQVEELGGRLPREALVAVDERVVVRDRVQDRR